MALQVIRLVLIGWQQVDHAVDKVNATSTAASVCEKRSVKRPTFFSACLLTFFFPSGTLSRIIVQNLSRHSRSGDTAAIPLTQLELPHALDSRRWLMQPKQDEQHPRRRGGKKKWKHFEAEVLILPCIQTSGKSVRACVSSDIKGQWVTSGNRRRADTRERMNHWWQIHCPIFFFWSFFSYMRDMLHNILCHVCKA